MEEVAEVVHIIIILSLVDQEEMEHQDKDFRDKGVLVVVEEQEEVQILIL
jgi:hypothetical protein